MKFKNEALVGMVVTAAILTIAIAGFWLTGRPWNSEQREVVAAFRRIGLLAEGNRVKFRGVTIGRVETIALLPRGDGVAVTMSIEPDLTLPADAGVVLSAESFFGDWQAEFVSIGQYPDLEFVRIEQRNVLPGAALPDITELTAVAVRISSDLETLSDRVQLAFTEETAVKIRETIENVQEVSEQLGGFFEQQTRTYGAVSNNVLAASANVRDATATAELTATDIRRTINTGEIQKILGNAREASENLNQLSLQLQGAASGVPGLVSRADTTIAEFGRTAQVIQGVVKGVEPAMAELAPTMVQARAAMTTLARAAAKIEEGDGTIGRLLEDPALYEETQRAIVTMRRLLADLQANPGKYIGKVNVF